MTARAGRAPWLAPEDLDDTQRAVYDAITGGPRGTTGHVVPLMDAGGRLYGPLNSMVLSPVIGQALQAFGAAVRYGLNLSNRERELVILEVARARRSEFEWYGHAIQGAAAGIGADELDALRTGSALDLEPRESVLLLVARALTADGDLDDELFAQAEHELGTALLNDVITLVGYYDLLALSLRVWRTPLPPGVESAF